jgi:hypothetical protein
MILLMKNHLMLCKIGKITETDQRSFFYDLQKKNITESVHPKKILFLGVHK